MQRPWPELPIGLVKCRIQNLSVCPLQGALGASSEELGTPSAGRELLGNLAKASGKRFLGDPCGCPYDPVMLAYILHDPIYYQNS